VPCVSRGDAPAGGSANEADDGPEGEDADAGKDMDNLDELFEGVDIAAGDIYTVYQTLTNSSTYQHRHKRCTPAEDRHYGLFGDHAPRGEHRTRL